MEAVFKPQDTAAKKEVVPKAIHKDSIVLMEIRTFYPGVQTFGISKIVNQADSLKTDTTLIALVRSVKMLSADDKIKVTNFLKLKYKAPNLQLFVTK